MQGQTEPFQGGAVEQVCAVGVVKAQRLDAAAGFLFPQRERIVGAEHYLPGARHIQQVTQRLVVVHTGVENRSA